MREDPVRKGLLFAGTETSVWVSFDDGDHWQSLQLNLPHTSMRDLGIHENDLIVATHGGGTALATQRECLDILGCVGKGKVRKLAEIVSGVVLAGELSLAAAISSLDWVSSHEKYGRNR